MFKAEKQEILGHVFQKHDVGAAAVFKKASQLPSTRKREGGRWSCRGFYFSREGLRDWLCQIWNICTLSVEGMWLVECKCKLKCYLGLKMNISCHHCLSKACILHNSSVRVTFCYCSFRKSWIMFLLQVQDHNSSIFPMLIIIARSVAIVHNHAAFLNL